MFKNKNNNKNKIKHQNLSVFKNLNQLFKDLTSLPVSEKYLHAPPLKFKTDMKTFFIASLGINLLSLALPMMTLQVYDRLLVSENLGTLVMLVSGIIVVIVVDFVLRLSRAYVSSWGGAIFEHTLLTNAVRHLMGADFNVVDQKTVGQHLENIEATTNTQDFHSGQAVMTLVDVPFVVLFMTLIYFFAGALVLVPVVLLFIFSALVLHKGKVLRERIIALEEQDSERLNFLVETLENIHTAKGLGLEDTLCRLYESHQNRSDEQMLEKSYQSQKILNFGVLFSRLMSVSVATFGALLAIYGEVTLGSLVACILLSGRIMQPVQRMMSLWGKYQLYLLCRQKIQDIFTTPHSKRYDPDDLGHNEGCLEIKNFSLIFLDGEKPVLEDINLKLEFGDFISISGAHNSGKTTLIRSILGLYKPTYGQIFLNSYDVNLYPARVLTKNVAYLPSEGTIFRGTVRDNITSFGDISEEQAMEMAKIMGLDKVIAHLPHGYDTYLEDTMADALPPGVKQRIAIVRALAPKPRVILFDHADRSLDKEGYNQIYRLLARLHGKATIVLVTNDLNLLRLAEDEYILEEGHLSKIAQNDEGRRLKMAQSYRYLNV